MNNNHSTESQESQVLLNQIALEYMREKKRRSIGRWIVRIFILLLFVWLAFTFFYRNKDEVSTGLKSHVGLIDIKGTIAEDQVANSDNFAKALDRAYESKGLKALIVRLDSPGGSPVQADYMYSAIQYYRQKYPDIKVYAVCMDACASAAYYIAAAAEDIYANPASLVGSIGVIYNGFGFVDTLHKLGISRRLQTAGRNKGFLDQFSPEDPEHMKRLQTMLNEIHQQFIERVKSGRGTRLVVDNDTFSGLFWTGSQAKERGLIDGFASSGQLAREVIKVDKIVDYTYKDNVLERMAKNIGASIANQLPSALGMKSGIS